MGFVNEVNFQPMVGDPDDHRPDTLWALVVDPAAEDRPFVQDVTLLFERIAPGDRIPLHKHSINEVVIVDRGSGEYRLVDETREVRAGSVVFIPAGTPHGTRNLGANTLDIHAIYPSAIIEITTIERNPAPGTEGDPPRPPGRSTHARERARWLPAPQDRRDDHRSNPAAARLRTRRGRW